MDYPGKVITKNQVTPTQTSATGVWTLDDAAAATRNNNWPVAGVPNPISKSLRFNSADSAYLNRTPASSGSRTTWTWSGWVKRGALGVNHAIISCGSYSTDLFQLFFEDATNSIRIQNFPNSTTANVDLLTTAVYRDLSAWYHIVVVMDTTQATSSNRVKLYVNGVQVTVFSTATYPAQNATPNWNTGSLAHFIGARNSTTLLYSGYMTETNFIDGQALTPSSFGMTDPVTGVWEPLKYSGTYGTNGFYLNFKDATSTTTLGLDYSGNANNWTTNNFSVTAGSGNDSLTDVPTPWVAFNTTGDVGGVVRGNYCTSNPIYKGGDSVLTNGNLNVRSGDSLTSFSCDRGTIAVSSGKWYYEFTQTNIYSVDPPNRAVGWGLTSTLNTTYPGGIGSYSYVFNGTKYVSTVNSAYGASWTTNDVIGLALDLDAGTLVCYKNGVSQGTLVSGLSGTFTPIYGRIGNDAGRWIEYELNFGQRPFAYTPPSGFRSLCTTNLPASTIVQGSQYFDVRTRSGTGATYSVTGLQFAPSLVWFKSRSTAYDNNLQDIVRGATNTLSSNQTDAEISRAGSVTSFNSDGYTGGSFIGLNASGSTYVDWMWNAGSSTVTNTSGTISSQVRANTTSGFSIVTYTGNGVDGATVGHGLGVAPNMVFVKRRDVISDWNTKHSSLSSNNVVFLNTTSAQQTPGSGYIGNLTSSTVITLVNGGAAITNVNGNGNTYVAYCFAAVSGYSAFGSYTGNGSTDGPFIYLGFRPRYILAKRTDSTGNWLIYDTTRDTFNGMDDELSADLNIAETTAAGIRWDALSNGIKMRNSGAGLNASGGTYIYMAFAENPFKNALAR